MKQWVGLAKLCEELAEVIQVAAKLNACPDGIYFDGKDLIGWLEEEMADAFGIIQFVATTNELVVDSRRAEDKYRKFCEWFNIDPHLAGASDAREISPRLAGQYYWVMSVEGGRKEVAYLNHSRDFCFCDWSKKAESSMFWIARDPVREPR